MWQSTDQVAQRERRRAALSCVAQGMEVDHRTDLQALSYVVYETVCGQRPFMGQCDQALLYEIVN